MAPPPAVLKCTFGTPTSAPGVLGPGGPPPCPAATGKFTFGADFEPAIPGPGGPHLPGRH